MIDIVKAFSDIVKHWNKNKRCGWCWEYEAPLRESDLNESEPKNDECCTRVFLTNYRISHNVVYHPSGYVRRRDINHSLTLRIVRQDDIGLNVYEEQEGHPLSESKWATILNPIRECVNFADVCTSLGFGLHIVSENWSILIDEYDMNYTGWKVDLVIKEENV